MSRPYGNCDAYMHLGRIWQNQLRNTLKEQVMAFRKMKKALALMHIGNTSKFFFFFNHIGQPQPANILRLSRSYNYSSLSHLYII